MALHLVAVKIITGRNPPLHSTTPACDNFVKSVRHMGMYETGLLFPGANMCESNVTTHTTLHFT